MFPGREIGHVHYASGPPGRRSFLSNPDPCLLMYQLLLVSLFTWFWSVQYLQIYKCLPEIGSFHSHGLGEPIGVPPIAPVFTGEEELNTSQLGRVTPSLCRVPDS